MVTHRPSVVLKELIDYGAVIDQNTLDMTSEDDVVASESVMELIRTHMDPYAGLEDEDDILMKACREGDLSKVQAMMDDGYDYTKWQTPEGGGTYQFFSPMSTAVRMGHMEIVSLFNELGVNVELEEGATGEGDEDGNAKEKNEEDVIINATAEEIE